MSFPPSSTAPAEPGSVPEQALSVSELNRSARLLLERHLPCCWIEGEISSLSQPSSGHAYFTLKDAHAQVRCALFRQQARFVAAPLREGAQVQVRAQISLYEPRGDYQLIVEAVRAVGHGALLQALEALRQRLNEEGLFAKSQPLPYPPRHLGLITSPTGAAIKDVMAVLAARWPGIQVSLLPVPVQGQQAPDAIVSALQAANRDERFDALLLTRGGGSFEDLNVFNDERIARALHASRIPVLSAIGHEIDSTIADLAADAAAPTPSAAAERLTPDQRDTRRRLVQLAHRLLNAQHHILHTARQRIDHLSLRLRDPSDYLRHQRQRLEPLAHRLWHAQTARLGEARQQLSLLQARLRHPQALLDEQRQRLMTLRQRLIQAQRQHFHHYQQRWQHLHERFERQRAQLTLLPLQQQLDTLHNRLQRAQHQGLARYQQRLAFLMHRLDGVSPLQTLKRGYAVVRSGQQVITQIEEVSIGQTLDVELDNGTLRVKVEEQQFKA
ncbi:exodeoxyribonuclease VII large subunit [Zymobacter sp. IVIA_12111.31 C1]|uniref:exodeoxyribonuclease VII large subunit n=1 Tax=Zymobacter sp. IVIA_12111.31 C1 TaxID=3394854 RepID=UPI0039C01400